MRTRALRRMLAALALPGAIATASAPGCEPRDIYLFDEAPVDEPEPRPPSESAPDDTDVEDAGLPLQPACDTPECESCVERGACNFEASTLLCHPVTASCRLPCDPDAPVEQPNCPADEHCDARGLCVECRMDADCGSDSLRACDGARGVCVECATDSHCPVERPTCDVEGSLCVECLVDGDCAATGEVCLPGAQRCVGCRNDADCSSFDEDNRCLPDELRCVECLVDGDCLEPDKPFCKVSEHECDDERD
jgi:hypothetical protein